MYISIHGLLFIKIMRVIIATKGFMMCLISIVQQSSAIVLIILGLCSSE